MNLGVCAIHLLKVPFLESLEFLSTSGRAARVLVHIGFVGSLLLNDFGECVLLQHSAYKYDPLAFCAAGWLKRVVTSKLAIFLSCRFIQSHEPQGRSATGRLKLLAESLITVELCDFMRPQKCHSCTDVKVVASL